MDGLLTVLKYSVAQVLVASLIEARGRRGMA